MKFKYHINTQNNRKLVLDDIPSMSGIQKISVNGKDVDVYMSDKFLEDFFGQKIHDLDVNQLYDFAAYGVIDMVSDALNEAGIEVDPDPKSIIFDTIDL